LKFSNKYLRSKKAINGLTAQIVLLHFQKIVPPEKKAEVETIIERSIDL